MCRPVPVAWGPCPGCVGSGGCPGCLRGGRDDADCVGRAWGRWPLLACRWLPSTLPWLPLDLALDRPLDSGLRLPAGRFRAPFPTGVIPGPFAASRLSDGPGALACSPWTSGTVSARCRTRRRPLRRLPPGLARSRPSVQKPGNAARHSSPDIFPRARSSDARTMIGASRRFTSRRDSSLRRPR